MFRPEAKAAEEILRHQIQGQHYATDTAERIIRKAMRDHYRLLLRECLESFEATECFTYTYDGDCCSRCRARMKVINELAALEKE